MGGRDDGQRTDDDDAADEDGDDENDDSDDDQGADAGGKERDCRRRDGDAPDLDGLTPHLRALPPALVRKIAFADLLAGNVRRGVIWNVNGRTIDFADYISEERRNSGNHWPHDLMQFLSMYRDALEQLYPGLSLPQPPLDPVWRGLHGLFTLEEANHRHDTLCDMTHACPRGIVGR